MTWLWRWLLALGRAAWRATAPARAPSFGIAALISLAAAIALGAAIPQESLTPVGELRARFGEAYPLMRALGLFSLYSAPWFLLLEGLLFASLALGSWQWLAPAWRAALKPAFLDATAMAAHPQAVFLAGASGAQARGVLKETLQRRGYRVVDDDGDRLYATRHAWARLGPFSAHLGVMTLLIASVYGAFTGFALQKTLTPGEAFALQRDADAFLPAMPAPFWRGAVPPWRLHLTGFRVIQNPVSAAAPSPTPRQYESDMVLQDSDNRMRARGTASVNHPLRVGGLSIYQSGFAPTGRLNLTVNGAARSAQTSQRLLGRPAAFMPVLNGGEAVLLVIFPAMTQATPQEEAKPDPSRIQAVLIRADGQLTSDANPSSGAAPQTLGIGQTVRLSRVTLRYDGPQWASALLIRHAPETPLAFAAFALIALGALSCLFTQRQCWLAPDADGRFRALALAHRPLPGFAREREAIYRELADAGVSAESASPSPVRR